MSLAMRRTAIVSAVTTAIAASLGAAPEFALEAFRRTAAIVVAMIVVAGSAGLRAIGCGRLSRRTCRTVRLKPGLAEMVPPATAITTPMALSGFAFTCLGAGGLGLIAAMLVAIMTRTPLLRTSARTPDFDQFRRDDSRIRAWRPFGACGEFSSFRRRCLFRGCARRLRGLRLRVLSTDAVDSGFVGGGLVGCGMV